MLTPEDRTYLANKHRGGINNFEGNFYENLYAIYKIALLLKLYSENQDDVILSSQIKEAFVDDLLISYSSGKLDFYQLKNVKSLTWSSGSSHTLQYDFERQKELMKEAEKRFSLFLIYSDKSSNVTSIPNTISDCTQANHFPYFQDLNRLLMESIEFKKAIAAISAYQSFQTDQLCVLATILLGVWYSLAQDNVPLTCIIQKIKKLPLAGNNFIFDETLQIDEEVKSILDEIPDFSYVVAGTIFCWSYKKRMKGEIQKTFYSNFEREVLVNKPTNFSELELLM